MQFAYEVNPAIAQAGQLVGPRESIPLTLASLAQIDEIVIADASEAAGETWTATVTDTESGQAYTVSFLSGADLEATLDIMLPALVAHGKINDLFTFAEDGVDTLTATARHNGRAYTWVVTPGGSATAAITTTQTSGGQKLTFGIMVARDGDDYFRAMAAGDAVANVAGILFRTDGNHFRDTLDGPNPAGFDGAARRRTFSIAEHCRCWVPVENAIPGTASAVHLRISGSGTPGAFRVDADGGDTIDVSAFCKWDKTSRTVGGVLMALLRVGTPG